VADIVNVDAQGMAGAVREVFFVRGLVGVLLVDVLLLEQTEAEEFLADVDRLRDDAERLEARIARLESRSQASRAPAVRG
jgi:hypothetical protein